jgi:hypothetical protein
MSKDRASALLQGAIDMHIHTAPDIYPRLVNDLEAAEQAKAAGMKAILIKCHVTSTGDRAQIATLATGFPVFGSICLNYPVGGVNHHAVRDAIVMGAKQIWMPTIHSAQYLKHVASVPMFAATMPKDLKGLTILDDEGKLIPEIDKILPLIAEANVMLGTGHLAKREAFPLVDAAIAAGVKKIVITHPVSDYLDYEHEDLKVLAAKGCYFDHDWCFCTPQVTHRYPPSAIADAIRVVGVERSVMATDTGQKVNPPPTECMRDFIAAMLDCGLTEEEIRVMTSDNPAKLIGIYDK